MSTPNPSSTPAPERSLNRQLVLEEDEYTAALSRIIARDFFPSLVHLDATNTYLDAVHSQDPELISASVRRLEELNTPAHSRGRPWQTPSETPYGGGPSDTPIREPAAKRPRYDADMSLDAFQAKYTSEDNSSFTHILNEENKRRKDRYSWAWEAQKRVEAQRERMIEGRERALIEAVPQGAGVRERLRIEVPVSAGLITAGGEEDVEKEEDQRDTDEEKPEGTGKEVVPKSKGKEMEEVVDVMAPKKDTRPAGVDGWNFKARNALMFAPGADISPYDPSSAIVRPIAKGTPKIIKHDNTRLAEQEEGPSTSRGMSAPPSPTRSRIDAAIAGTPYRPRSPGINNFSYVPSMPSPTPSELGPDAVKQLMTWGTLTGTPRILSSSQSDDPVEPPTTPFHISAPSARENLSHRLSSSAAKSLRAKANLLGSGPPRPGAGRKGDMAPPLWTPRRADAPGALTPAAKRLLDRTTMGTAAARRAEAMGRMAGWEGKKDQDLNRVRWTPTPSPVTRR